MNDAGTKLPSMLPHQLFAPDMRTYMEHLNRQRICLERRFPEAEISKIVEEFAALKRSYRTEPQSSFVLSLV